MSKSPYAARRHKFRKNRSATTYTSLVGQIVWASNTLHATFAAIFMHLMKQVGANGDNPWTGYDVGHNIWHTLRSDDIQRTVLQAICWPVLETKPRELKSLTWAIQSAGKLSEFRNDAVHAPFGMQSSSRRQGQGWETAPSGLGSPHRIRKLRHVGANKLFRSVIGDLIQLDAYAGAILDKLYGDKTRLPRRPSLRSIQLIQQALQGSSNPQPSKAKSSRRSSFPGK